MQFAHWWGHMVFNKKNNQTNKQDIYDQFANIFSFVIEKKTNSNDSNCDSDFIENGVHNKYQKNRKNITKKTIYLIELNKEQLKFRQIFIKHKKPIASKENTEKKRKEH